MDEWQENQVSDYLELLNEVKDSVSNEHTAALIVSEVAKDRRMKRISQQRNSDKEPATVRQKRFMEKLGIDYDEGVSKQQASDLIDEELAKNGQK